MEKQEMPYSVPVGEKRPGQSFVHRNPESKDKLLEPPAQLQTLQDMWRNSSKRYAANKYLEDLTYEEVDRQTVRIGSWLREHKVDLVYIHSINRLEWTLVDVACMRYGIITVPLYDTLGKEALDHILTLTQGKVLIQSKVALANLLKAHPDSLKNVERVICFDDIEEGVRQQLQGIGIEYTPFKELLASKAELPEPALDPELPVTYSFTSGTTGKPKGVVMTHKNYISCWYGLKDDLNFCQTDVHLSYLPLAHSFERLFSIWVMGAGANVRYYSGAVQDLVKDMARIRPTIIPFVPRLLNRYFAYLSPFSHVPKELAQEALKIKRQNWEKGNNTSPYDDTVFKPARELFGGRLRLMIVGSAPISSEVLEFFRMVLGIDIQEAYGQTETSAVSTTHRGEKQAGSVGGINRAIQFKLVDIPEMNYYSDGNPPIGEICLKGEPIFKRYYNDEVRTKQTFDSEGWMHSGDVGTILPNGSLKIVDRKKNIYKLSHGQYIAPEKIENVYQRSNYVAEIFMYGDSLQNYNVAIVTPNKEAFMKFVEQHAKEHHGKSFEELCNVDQVCDLLTARLNEQAKKEGLQSFELARKIRLNPVSFAVYGLLTQTMKLQRHLAKKHFESTLASLYKQSPST